MNQQNQAATERRASPESTVARRDSATASIVKKGITLQQIHGTKYAAEFLKEKNVDIEIVMRVLLNERRHDDLPELADLPEDMLADGRR